MAREPRNPEVSGAVCSPASLQRRRISPVKADWSSGSPPVSFTPPPAVVMKARYFSISVITSSTVASRPSRMCQVSGLAQYRQRSGQPLTNRTNRVPGPSTPVDRSQEWIRPATGLVAVFTTLRGRCG